MEIIYRTGDATQPEGPGEKIIVHVCNDTGGWGRGFVVAISRRWPAPEREYRAWFCGEIPQPFVLGEVQLVRAAPEIMVANLIGQHGLANRQHIAPVRYEAIRLGLRRVASHARELAASVHMPRIGCGLAGGRWEEIEPIIRDELCAQGVPVTVYDLPVG
jgi:O-acetyl-ADP-ribose deacetylase (regulator of RNase III)